MHIFEAEEAPHDMYLGRKRIMTSPSPVAAAAPAELSTKAPAPTMGESPMRLKGGRSVNRQPNFNGNTHIVYYN